MIVSHQAKWALSQIENALLKRDELDALNQVNRYIDHLEERVKTMEGVLRSAEKHLFDKAEASYYADTVPTSLAADISYALAGGGETEA